MKTIKSSVRNDIMLKIVESYRDKNVSKLNDGSFNIMTAFSKTDMKYSEFLEIVRFLESKRLVIYIPADKSSTTYNIRGEEIRQDFIQLTDLGKTYPEDTKSEKITDSAAMTLRLDGTGKDIGTATYNTTTGDIKAVKGATSQTVALVVQGNDGTNNWYYSKKITGTDVVNVSDIVAESNTPASIDLSACKIWLEITEDNVTYVVNATETVVSEISSCLLYTSPSPTRPY